MRQPQKHWALKISTLVVVTACFVVMAASLVVSQNFKKVLTLWGEDVQMTIYLDQDVSSDGRKEIETKIREFDQVAEVKFVSQETALSEFRAQMASYAPEVSRDVELLKLIPSSLQVSLKPEIAPAEQMSVLESLSVKLKSLEGVDEVSFGQEWISKYAALVEAIEGALKILGAIILLAALFVISNVIRASVASRKDEIVVLEMFGATSSMIRRPYLVEGASLGFFSSALALAFCFVVYLGLKKILIIQLSFLQLGQHIQFLSVPSVLIFVGVGTGLGAMASYLCVRRLNDGFSGSQDSL